jgi:hypothetical protein
MTPAPPMATGCWPALKSFGEWCALTGSNRRHLPCRGGHGSPIAPELIHRAKQALPHVKLVQVYGLSETGFLTGLRDHEHTASRLLSCGRGGRKSAIKPPMMMTTRAVGGNNSGDGPPGDGRVRRRRYAFSEAQREGRRREVQPLESSALYVFDRGRQDLKALADLEIRHDIAAVCDPEDRESALRNNQPIGADRPV